MLGQLELAEMNETYRAKSAPESSLRRITHSTSFLATGSEMFFLISVASDCLLPRTSSTARFTAATSMAAAVTIVVAAGGMALTWAGDVAVVEVCAGSAILIAGISAAAPGDANVVPPATLDEGRAGGRATRWVGPVAALGRL